ncbi:PREDICTED: uncharacterized protein LOC105362034 [Ceratosolen solmsi marchali]|uniref:Uncharacterized protein LOC105362034 n=1 Tax=Ceratosolen solmsi marchali TaxID=326594 RepID=A0AAJ6YGJ9_9HYME|nr:PREDICTED: uncharacterized protein LOC105362034 [Ceratosolen solmsi marchali]
MLTDNQSNTDRILNLKTENTSNANPVKKLKIQETRYQCIVCQTNKISLSELHWHQTYQHSTEELSLSVIGWKGLVKIVGPPTPQEKENSQERSIWSSFSKKPSQFYYLSSSILRVKENQKGNSEAPIDCSLPVLKVEKDIESLNQAKEKIPIVSIVKQDSSVNKKLQKELNTIKEISMEDFVKCTNELCSELAEYKRIRVSKKSGRKKHVL